MLSYPAVASLLVACYTLTVRQAQAKEGEDSTRISLANGHLLLVRSSGAEEARDGEYCSKWQGCQANLHCDLDYGGFGTFGLGKCRLSTVGGIDCGVGLNQCSSPAKCTEGVGGRLCRVELQVGGDCRDLRRTRCASGLQCRGTVDERRCEKPLSKGHRCDGGHRYCAKGLICRLHIDSFRCVTVVGINVNCADSFTGCSAGLQCFKFPNGRRCRPALNKGKTCNPPVFLCMPGLTCVNSRCQGVVGEFGNCSDPFMICMKGLQCSGPKNNRRCTRLSKKSGCTLPHTGGDWSASPSDSSKTENPKSEKCAGSKRGSKGCINVNSGDSYSTLPLASASASTSKSPSASASPSTTKAALASVSASPSALASQSPSPSTYMRYPSQVQSGLPARGQSCILPERKCAAGLICLGDGAKARCNIVLGDDGDCQGSFVLCKNGLNCIGPDNRRRCRRAQRKGKGCNAEYLYCLDELKCIPWGNTRRCVALIGLNSLCGGGFTLCEAGLKCTSTANGKRCTRDKQISSSIALPGKGEKCKMPERWCRTLHMCLGPSSNSKCY
eukprot:IDg11199t1